MGAKAKWWVKNSEVGEDEVIVYALIVLKLKTR